MRTLLIILILSSCTACQKEIVMPIKESKPFSDTGQAVQMIINQHSWKSDIDTVFFERNELGQIIKRITERRFFHYTYDGCQRLAKEIVFVKKNPLDTSYVKEFFYDDRGRVSKILFLAYENNSSYLVPESKEIIDYPNENTVVKLEYSIKNGFHRKREAIFENGNLVHFKSIYGGGSLEYEYFRTYTDIPSPTNYRWIWTDFHFRSKNMPKTEEFIDYTGLIDFACINEKFEYTLNNNGNPESIISGCGTTRFIYGQ